MAGDNRVKRITVEVDGYRWLVHGHRGPIEWTPHLVELIGYLWLDVLVSEELAQRIKEAVASRLGGAKIGSLKADLILA